LTFHVAGKKKPEIARRRRRTGHGIGQEKNMGGTLHKKNGIKKKQKTKASVKKGGAVQGG